MPFSAAKQNGSTTIAATAAEAKTAVVTGGNTVVDLYNAGPNKVYVEFGNISAASPTAAVLTSYYVPASTRVHLHIDPTINRVSTICAATESASLVVTFGTWV